MNTNILARTFTQMSMCC